MAVRLRPPNEQIVELVGLLDLGVEKLSQAAKALEARDDILLQPSQLVLALSGVLDRQNAESLVRQLLSLNGLTRRFTVQVEEIVEGLKSPLSEAMPDAVAFKNAWGSVEKVLIQLLKSKSVRLAATVIELSYDYANLVRNVRILTDIRPLYDEAAEKIEGAVISHTMRLHYDSAGGEHDLSLAMDEKDILNLMEQCKRAMKKSQTAKSTVGFPSFISGQPSEIAND